MSAKKPSLENTRNFHLFRNLYNRVLKAAKKKYFDDEFQKNTRNLKKTWELINSAINSVKSKQSISTLFVNGINVTDPCIIANELNKFFLSAPLTIVEKIPFAEPPEVKFHNPISFSMNDSPITETEIIEAVNLLLPKKSEDMYGFSMKFIKKVILCIVNPLYHVFFKSFETGTVPSQLKIAKVVPIFKNKTISQWKKNLKKETFKLYV